MLFSGRKSYLCRKIQSKVPMRKNKKFLVIAGQILFFTVFGWYYVHNSFLRPACEKNIEWTLAIALVLAMAVNYWLIYPFFYKKHTFWHYTIASFVEALLVTVLEYCLTLDIVLSCLPQGMPEGDVSKLKNVFFFNLLLRDSCLLGFIGLMANNLRLNFKLLETDAALLKRKSQVIALRKNEQYVLEASNLCYLIQIQNYTDIHANDGYQYRRRGAMSFFETLKNSHGYVKISKNCAVFLPYVQSLTDKEVTVRTDETGNTVSLPLGSTIAPAAILDIEHYLQNKKNEEAVSDNSVMNNSPEKKRASRVVDDSLQGIPKEKPRHISAKIKKKQSNILKYISKHADCNISDIVTETKYPKSTVTRILGQLKADGLIEYAGSKKTGGYRVKESTVEAPAAESEKRTDI